MKRFIGTLAVTLLILSLLLGCNRSSPAGEQQQSVAPSAPINRPMQVLPEPQTVYVSVDPKVSWLDEIPQDWITISDLKAITQILNGEAAPFKGKPRPYSQTFSLAFETFRSHYLQPGATIPVLAVSQTGEQAIVIIDLGGNKASGAYINLDQRSQNVSYSITKHEVRERKP